MTLTITATETIVHVDGQPARLWLGRTEDGVPCKVFVSRIAVHQDDDSRAFERDLQSMPVPNDPSLRQALAEIDAARPTCPTSPTGPTPRSERRNP